MKKSEGRRSRRKITRYGLAVWCGTIAFFATSMGLCASLAILRARDIVCPAAFAIQFEESQEAGFIPGGDPHRRPLYVWSFHLGFDDPQVSIFSSTPLGWTLQTHQDPQNPRGRVSNWMLPHHVRDSTSLMFFDPVSDESLQTGPFGQGVLERLSSYALTRMESSDGYIGPETVQAQSFPGPADPSPRNLLQPNQVRFFEVTERRTFADLKDKFGEVPPFARPDSISRAIDSYFRLFDDYVESGPSDGDPYILKTGSVMLISGQPQGRPSRLFLDNKSLLKPINRNELPFVWEISRGAKSAANGFSDGMRAAIFYALAELVLHGGQLHQGTVFGRLLSEDRAKIMLERYGNQVHSGYKNLPGHLAVRARLQDYLDRLPVYQVSPVLHSLTSIFARSSRGAKPASTSTFQAMQLLVEAQALRNVWLTVPGPSGSPKGNAHLVVQLRDFSKLGRALYERMLQRQGISSGLYEEAREVFDSLELEPEHRDYYPELASQQGGPYRTQATGSDVPLKKFLTDHNSIEVSFPGLRLSRDEVERLLVAALDNRIELMKSLGLVDPVAELERLGVTFAVSYDDRVPSQTLSRIKRKDHWYVRRSEVYALRNFWFGKDKTILNPALYADTEVYTLAEVLSLRAEVKGPRLRRGQYHAQQVLNRPYLLGF